jgi:hypothetical protein
VGRQRGGGGNTAKIPATAPQMPMEGMEDFYQPWRKSAEVALAPVVPTANFTQMNEDQLLTYVTRTLPAPPRLGPHHFHGALDVDEADVGGGEGAERRGLWHEMATALTRLSAMGVSSELINDICSLSPREQNLWVVASSVFYSLIASPLCSAVVGKYFNSSGQAELYELRVRTLLPHAYPRRCRSAPSSSQPQSFDPPNESVTGPSGSCPRHLVYSLVKLGVLHGLS